MGAHRSGSRRVGVAGRGLGGSHGEDGLRAGEGEADEGGAVVDALDEGRA